MAGTTTSSKRTQRAGADVTDNAIQHNLLVDDVEVLRRRGSNIALSTAGLVIKAGGGVLVKAGTAFRYFAVSTIGNKPVYGLVAANTDMASLVGITVTNAKFNIIVFSLKDDGAGAQTLKATAGTEGATRPAVVLPSIPADEVVIGMIEVNPTGTGNFVGGTTALDDATVVPNVVYVNTPYPTPWFRPGQAAADLTGAKVGVNATAISSTTA